MFFVACFQVWRPTGSTESVEIWPQSRNFASSSIKVGSTQTLHVLFCFFLLLLRTLYQPCLLMFSKDGRLLKRVLEALVNSSACNQNHPERWTVDVYVTQVFRFILSASVSAINVFFKALCYESANNMYKLNKIGLKDPILTLKWSQSERKQHQLTLWPDPCLFCSGPPCRGGPGPGPQSVGGHPRRHRSPQNVFPRAAGAAVPLQLLPAVCGGHQWVDPEEI